MSISPKRIMYLDEVRSLAIMLVVIGHVSRLFSYDFNSWLFCSGVFSLTRIGVPLFFTVSGSLLLTRKYEVKKFLEKQELLKTTETLGLWDLMKKKFV